MQLNHMRRFLGWALLSIAVIVLAVALYWVKLGHDLGAGLEDELSRRFTAAAALVNVLDGAPIQSLSQEDGALVGQAAVAEFLMSFRVAGYHVQHGALPRSIQELDSSRPGKEPSPLDPWGNPFRLVPTGKDRFLIVSGGPSGDSLLSPQEITALKEQLVGKTYRIHGKVIFSGRLTTAPAQDEENNPSVHSK